MAIASMALFELDINEPPSSEAVQMIDTTRLYHSIMSKCFGFDAPDELNATQACHAAWFTVDGLYVYLT